jgi:hypothetical protein
MERLLRLTRECGFVDITAALERELREDILPGVTALLCMVDGEERAAVAKRHRRVKKLMECD